MTTVPAWLPMPAAAKAAGRSRRTIRRWLADPDLGIRTLEEDGVRKINTSDLMRAEARKHDYSTAPTFGRKPV